MIEEQLTYQQKLDRAKTNIMEFYGQFEGKVFISFSGGKDSTVLLDIARKLYPGIEAVFIDTGLEYPEIREFVKTFSDVTWLKPKLTFKEVLDTYGYPIISKEVSEKIMYLQKGCSKKLENRYRNGVISKNGKLGGKVPKKWLKFKDAPFKISNKCCKIMKKDVSKSFIKSTGKFPILGVRKEESSLRRMSHEECNSFKSNPPTSWAIGSWLKEDVDRYVKENNIKLCSLYEEGKVDRTGCMFCMYGLHLEKYPNRFERMKKTHPVIYKYCMEKLGLAGVIDYYLSEGASDFNTLEEYNEKLKEQLGIK